MQTISQYSKQLIKEEKAKLAVAKSAKRIADSINRLINSSRDPSNPKTNLTRLEVARQKLIDIKAMKRQYPYLILYELAETESNLDKYQAEAKRNIQLKEIEKADKVLVARQRLLEKSLLEKAKQNAQLLKENERQQRLKDKQAEKEKKAQLALEKEWERQKLNNQRLSEKTLLESEKERARREKVEALNNLSASKDEKARYLQKRESDAFDANHELEERIYALGKILTHAPLTNGTILSKPNKQYRTGDRETIVAYNENVLGCSEYSDEFPKQFNVAYNVESKELVIDYELPPLSIIPTENEFRYVKTKDIIEKKPRKSTEINELYQDVVASVALRTIHEVFVADQGGHLEVAVFSGFVNTFDPATGKSTRPYLISIRAVKSIFMEFDLARIDKRACLRNLGAQLSPQPSAMQPVKPIVYFEMTDKRFVEYGDVLAGLETRPNLMELNPWEFENLVSNLFAKWGLDTKLTRSTKDGGVDAIAFDTRAFLGGKFVIQAKRYKNTVGVSAVRDLYGTMLNEGANKGILVTTSGYGPDAFNFAKDKPIELIDGGQLLYMLDQVGIQAKIIMPEEGQVGFNEFENMLD